MNTDPYEEPDFDTASSSTAYSEPQIHGTTRVAALDPYELPSAATIAVDPYEMPGETRIFVDSDGYDAPEAAKGTKMTASCDFSTSDDFLDTFDVLRSSDSEPMAMETERNWNEEFQTALLLPDGAKKFETLKNLEVDFVHVASMYGKIIISELRLPVSKKTIRPVNVGGIAGGEKFVAQGILFKFAVDVEGLYGGDENAMKAASHDLKGLMGFFSASISALCVPLMALIDYKGFRLQALSLLPIGKDTLKYGSADGARTVHTDDPTLNALMQDAARHLNVKPHRVGPEEILLHAVADIEGHRGRDGRFYILDFARTFPPEPVTATTPRGAMLYRLLRPEFVMRYPTPLSPDAFSMMGRHNAAEHNAELQQAFLTLKAEVVPAFEEKWRLNPGSLADLTPRMHAAGLNIRHLGLVRAASTDEAAREVLLVEAVARIAKNSLRALLRREARSIGVEAFNVLSLEFLNMALQGLDAGFEFWTAIKQQAVSKFAGLLDGERTEWQQFGAIPHLMFFRRVTDLLSVTLDPVAWSQLDAALGTSTLQSTRGFVLVQPDVVSVESRVKRIGLVAYADAMQLFYAALAATGDNKMRLLRVTKMKMEKARQSMVSDKWATFHLARTMQEMAECTSDAQECAELLGQANETLVALRSERIDPNLDAAIVSALAFLSLERLRALLPVRTDKGAARARLSARAATALVPVLEDTDAQMQHALTLDETAKAKYALARVVLWRMRAAIALGATDVEELAARGKLLLSGTGSDTAAFLYRRFLLAYVHVETLGDDHTRRLRLLSTAGDDLRRAVELDAAFVVERMERFLARDSLRLFALMRDVDGLDGVLKEGCRSWSALDLSGVPALCPPIGGEQTLESRALAATTRMMNQRGFAGALRVCPPLDELRLVGVGAFLSADVLAACPVARCVVLHGSIDTPDQEAALCALLRGLWRDQLIDLDVSACHVSAATWTVIGTLPVLATLSMQHLADAPDGLESWPEPLRTLAVSHSMVLDPMVVQVASRLVKLTASTTNLTASAVAGAVHLESLDFFQSQARESDLMTWALESTALSQLRLPNGVRILIHRGDALELRAPAPHRGARWERAVNLPNNRTAFSLVKGNNFGGRHTLSLIHHNGCTDFSTVLADGRVLAMAEAGVFEFLRTTTHGRTRVTTTSKATGEQWSFEAQDNQFGGNGQVQATLNGRAYVIDWRIQKHISKLQNVTVKVTWNGSVACDYNAQLSKMTIAPGHDVGALVAMAFSVDVAAMPI